MATNKADDAYDEDLSLTLQQNLTSYHVAGPLTTQVYTREGQSHGGPSLVAQLNQQGTGDCAIDLQCPTDEAILVGSITFVARGHIVSYNAAGVLQPGWQSTQHNQANYAQTDAQNANQAGRVHIPFYTLNSQFTQLDLEIGQTQSVNAYLPLTRSSEFGPGPLGILNQYWNQPADSGYYHENSTSHTASANHLVNCSVAAHTDHWVAQERVCHQLNMTHNLLSSWDFDDHEDRRILPRGMNLRIRGCTRPWADRATVFLTHNQLTLRLVFDSMRVVYSTVKIPHSHRDSEPIESLFATIDSGLRAHALVAGQRSITVPVTHTDADIVPGVIVAFVALNTAFNTQALTQTPSVITTVPGALTTVRCNLNGNGMPDFMSIYMESTCNPTDLLHRCAMINAFLGRAGNMAGRSRQGDRSSGETHLMSYTAPTAANAAAVLAINSIIIVTDPSTTVVREAGSGVLTGRLDLQIDLAANMLNTHRLYILSFTKQQIGISKVREQEGTQPQYVLSVAETRPAYTRVTVEEMSY